MGTEYQNAQVRDHLGIVCKKCGCKIRFQIRYGNYTKCKCARKIVKDTELSFSMDQRNRMSKVTRAMEPIRGFNTLRLRKWPKQKRRDIAK